jgi:hypothetical protein
VAEVLLRKAERLRTNPDQSLKLLMSSAPGIGKTSLVNLIARALASHPVAIEDVIGKEGSLGIPSEAVGSLYCHHPADRGRGGRKCQGRDGGFGDVFGVMGLPCWINRWPSPSSSAFSPHAW